MLAIGACGVARPRMCDSRVRWTALPARLASLAVAAVIVALMSSPSAIAQSREVLIGTMTTGEAEPGPDHVRASEELLADGIAALERGDVMLGRRRLEVLVERYPETNAAAVARDELGALYSTRQARGFLAVRDAGDPRPSAVRPPEPEAAVGRGAEAEAEARTAPEGAGERELSLARLRQAEGERRLRVLALDFQMAAGDRVFFAESSSDLGAKARAVLAAQARWLAYHPGLPVTVEAHADDHSGSRELDIRLAEKRGQSVRERLLEEGVSADRITVRAFGRDRPVAACPAPECAVQNRRVVTRIGSMQGADSVARRGVESPAYATAPRGAARDRAR